MILQVRHCLTVITGIFVLLAVGWTEVSTAQQPAPRTAPTIQGSVDIRDGRHVRFRYYFNHNALKDCVRVGNSLIALTESGNLIRFDAETLRLQGQAIIPGRGTAIAPASNRVLIGTEDGRIYGVDPASLLKAAPTGVFDAIADSDGWVLLATAQGLFRLRLEDGQRKPIPSPSLSEEIKSICRDEQGRLWAAGRRLYVSSDEEKRWNNVELPMVSDTYTKRVRPNPMAPVLILALPDRGVVFLDW
jgi:hypothetical protein